MLNNKYTASAIALLCQRGRIEVNLIPKNEARFRRIYKKLTGRVPDRQAYSVAKNPRTKGGDQLRLLLLDTAIESKKLVEAGLGIVLGKGSGGRGWRKGDNDLCIDLIAAGLDIGGRTPRLGMTKTVIAKRLKTLVNEQREYLEGFKREVTRELVTRNRTLVEQAKRRFGYACLVCGFDFGYFYGPSARGFIEGHHLEPLSSYGGARKVKVSDVRPVCSNCHRMLHRGKKLLSIERLKRMIQEEGQPVPWPWS